MKEIALADFVVDCEHHLDAVVDNKSPLLIKGESGAVVMISLDEYNSIHYNIKCR